MKLTGAFLCGAMLMASQAASAQTLAAPSRVATEDWSYARTAAQQSPWKDWVAQERIRLDNWMAVPRDNPLWNAGWAHDFIDPKTGAFIPWTPSTNCLLYGAVNTTMFSACLMTQRTYNITTTLSATRMGQLTGDNRYLDWAAAQLDIYRQIYLSHTDRTRGALFIQLLDEATVTASLTDAVRLLRPYVGDARAAAWCSDMLKPTAGAMLGARKQLSNITAWYNVSAAMAAMECGEPALLQEALDNTAFGLTKLLTTGLSGDGFWYELSPQYQAYVTSALSRLLVSASLHGEVARLQPVWPQLQAMLRAPNALALGDGEGPITNDMNKAGGFPNTTLFLEARRVITSQLGSQAAGTAFDWPQLLDPPWSAMADNMATVDTASKWVPGARTLVLRQKDWSGLIRGGQLATFHAHQDTLSIELKYGSTWLFRNSVTPGYGSDLQRNFYKLAAAVSTPLVNNNGTSNWFRPLDSYTVAPAQVSAKQSQFASGVTAERNLTVDGAGALRDTVTFTTTDTTSRVFAQLYHSDCTLPDFPAPTTSTAIQKVSPYLLNWETLGKKTKYWTLRLSCNGKTFVTTVSASRAFTPWRANGPALGPARRRTALLFEMDPGTSASMVYTIVPGN